MEEPFKLRYWMGENSRRMEKEEMLCVNSMISADNSQV
jgi:hypothetical protein